MGPPDLNDPLCTWAIFDLEMASLLNVDFLSDVHMSWQAHLIDTWGISLYTLQHKSGKFVGYSFIYF